MNIALRHAMAVTVLCALSGSQAATLHTDTVTTSHGNKIELSYQVAHADNRVTVTFGKCRILRLSPTDAKYQSRLRELAVSYFERRADEFEGISKFNHKGFTINTVSTVNAAYTAALNSNGYVPLWDGTEMELHLTGDGNRHTVSLPLYIVLHEDKSGLINRIKGNQSARTVIDAAAHPLTIDLNRPKPAAARQRAQAAPAAQAGGQDNVGFDLVPITQEVSTGGNEDEIASLEREREVNSQISMVEQLLLNQDGERLSESLISAIAQLSGMKTRASASQLAAIERLEVRVNDKRAELSARAAQAKADEQAEQQRLKDEAEQQAQSDRKRTIWMIVGGALLAILLFVGKEVMQTLRNRSNRLSMERMQQQVMNRTQNEVRRRTRNAVQSAVNKSERAAKQTVKRTVDRSKETLQQKAERAARGTRMRNKSDDGHNISI